MVTQQDSVDFIDLQRELIEIFSQEKRRLQEFLQNLTACEQKSSSLLDLTISTLIKDGKQALRDIDCLLNYIKRSKKTSEEVTELFNVFLYVCASLIKKSINLRFLLTRHTPTLRGIPRVLHPLQQNTKNITVDYLRACCLFEVPSDCSGISWLPHPIIDAYAEQVSRILWKNISDKMTSLAFNGALGAIKTARSVIERHAFEGRKIIAHSKAWLEITSDIAWSNTGLYTMTQELNASQLFHLFAEGDAIALCVEPIYNHPYMEVTELEEFLNMILGVDSFEHPKYLLIDNAHTPEIDTASMFKDKIPGNLCVCVAVSTVKFLQAGWDISKGGVLSVLYDKDSWIGEDPLTEILQFRENMGTGPSFEEAALMAIETSHSFSSRMARYDRNMRLLEEKLGVYFASNNLGEIGACPGAKLLYLNVAHDLNLDLRAVYRDILEVAESSGVPLMDASSFGMCSPHIHFVMHPDVGPVIRLSPGSTNYSIVFSLCEVITGVLDTYIK